MDQFHETNHHLRHVTKLASRLLHVKALSKAEIAQNIENEPGDLMLHVHRPGKLIAGGILVLAHEFEPAVNILLDEDLGATQCALREGVVEHTSLARMLGNTSGAPGVDGVLNPRPDLIVVALPDIALGAKDGLVTRRRVDHHSIGCVAERGTCLTVSTNGPE